MVAWVRLMAKLVWINLEQGLGPQSVDTPSFAGNPPGRGSQLRTAAWPPLPTLHPVYRPSHSPCSGQQQRAVLQGFYPEWPSPPPGTTNGQVRSQGGAKRSQRCTSCALRQLVGSRCVCVHCRGRYLEVSLPLRNPVDVGRKESRESG